MTKVDIEKFIDNIWLPERISGNEEYLLIVPKLKPIVMMDREPLMELLRDWISARPIRETNGVDYGKGKQEWQLFLALEVTEKYRLVELCPDIEHLVKDIRRGKTYMPYYADMVERYLTEMPET